MRVVAFLICVAAAFAPGAPFAKTLRAEPWTITKPEWTEADEKGFGDFVRALGHSSCEGTVDCLRDPANPYRDSDPRSLAFIADCADLPYMLRAYYAWKNHLPFAYALVSGAGGDIRYSINSNRVAGRRSITDPGGGISGPALLSEIHNGVSTATYRTDAAQEGGVLSDFYAPKIAQGVIRAGTVIYDINGHVGLVYDVDDDGRALYVDAHPDHTISRSVYGAQFGQSPAKLGGGLKNWRPMRLVGFKMRKDGRLVGGRVTVAGNDEIADFSLEQYYGNLPGTKGDGADARFTYNGLEMRYYEFVRFAISNGRTSYDPVYELSMRMRTLCNDMKDRAQFVNQAIDHGIQTRPQPKNLPDNIYGTGTWEWEVYSTPSRDARLKTGFASLYLDLQRMIMFWQNRDPRVVYDGVSLQDDLRAAYTSEAAQCTLTYRNSQGELRALDYNDMVTRLFRMDFDPYHCIERRWGEDGEGLASCKDDATKTAWYEAEQRLRNQIDRDYDVTMDFTLADLQAHIRNTGQDDPPDIDVRKLIDAIGARTPFAQMAPVGH